MSKISNNIKKYWSIFFKILLLCIGFAGFFGLMPQAYGIFDDVLTAYVIMVFWLELNITKLMFGTKNKLLDKITIGTFYVLIINTFVRWFQEVNIADPVIINTYKFISKILPDFLSNGIKSSFLFVHNPANSQFFSLLSSYIGFSALLLIILYMVFKIKFHEKSLVYAISHIFIKKEEFWDKINDLKEKLKDAPIRLILVTITVLFIYQYMFLLITQWFLVSLDKTLFVFAILYTIKDIKGSKIETLNKMGQFDDVFLGWITEFLTDKKKLYLSIGVLLLLHYLTDLYTFFVAFLFPVIGGIDSYFQTLMGIDAYRPIIDLIRLDSVYGIIEAWWVYILSVLGVLLLIIIPIIILFFTIMKVDLNKILKNKRFHVFSNLFLVSIVTFFLAPWIKQLVIKSTGIQGVNFVTQTISSASFFSIPTLFYISFFLLAFLTIILVILRNKTFAKYIFIISYLLSMTYLGQYIWNYFQSSITYHFNIILYSGNIFISIMFSILFLVEFLFYIGGFIMLCYKFSEYVISNIIKELITDVNIIIWTIIFLLAPIIIMYNLSIVTLTWASIAIAVLAIFTYAMSKCLTGIEYRDNYLLGVGVTILIYQIGLIIVTILSGVYNIDEGLINFMQPAIILVLSFSVLWYFELKINLKDVKSYKIVQSIIVGLVFGALFYLINEPRTILPNYSFVVVLVFTLLVALAEEILFRGVLFKLADKAFSYGKAIVLQAVVFAGIHFISLKYILEHYVINKSMFLSSAPLLATLYFIFLVLFGIVAAYLTRKPKELQARIEYPIIMHWIVNLLVYMIVLL